MKIETVCVNQTVSADVMLHTLYVHVHLLCTLYLKPWESFRLVRGRIQVETPGSYGSLQEYFTHYQAPRALQSIPRPLQNGTGTEQQQSTTEVVMYIQFSVYIITW